MIRSVSWYDGWIRSAIIAFKYEGERARATHLAGLMQPLVLELSPDVALVPVPLHRSRERRRGYNQSALLANALRRSTGIRVEHLLVRTVATRRQVDLSAEERAKNVQNAFALAPGADPQGLRIVLIDDVLTTGATLGACAGVLKAAGAAHVAAVTIARDR